MIETVLDRIAVALEKLANPPRFIQCGEELTGQLVPDTLSGLTPGIYTNSVPDTPAVGGANIGPSTIDGSHNIVPAAPGGGGPAHHTGTFIAPPPADDDTPDDGAELDSAGRRWDARIHSTARTKVKNTGEWKLLRGVDKALVAAVFAEQVGAAPTAPPNPTPTPTQTIAPPPAGAVAQPVPTAPTMKDFVTKVVAAGYTMETMQPFLAAHGIPALPSLVKSPELIPVILAEMGVM